MDCLTKLENRISAYERKDRYVQRSSPLKQEEDYNTIINKGMSFTWPLVQMMKVDLIIGKIKWLTDEIMIGNICAISQVYQSSY